MARLQKKKTATQKYKQKIKQQKKELNTGTSSAGKDAPKKYVAKKVSADKAAQEPGLIEKCRIFLREVNVEIKKVVWPTRNQVVASTAVVIVLVVIVSSFLGLFDVGLKGLIRMVLQ